MKSPIKLEPATAWRTYLGGSRIREFHGNSGTPDDHFPEEWIMSITACRNVGREHIKDEGLSKDTGGLYLKDIMEGNPKVILGEKHYEIFGATTGVLIKLIDSAERLSIQVHPNKDMARIYFNSEYGKTESWHILDGREMNGEKPCIYLGFKEGITKEYWKQVFFEQDIPKMLSCLNKIEVNTGDTYLIKGGVPHAIGAGCFLMEVQEPTDYTIRTERTTVSGFKIADEMCHQGIGFDNMFECFDYQGMNLKDTIAKYKLEPKHLGETEKLVSYDDTKCFALMMLNISSEYESIPEDVFYGIYVLSGKGTIEIKNHTENIKKGDQYFVPAKTYFKIKASERLKVAKYYGPNPNA